MNVYFLVEKDNFDDDDYFISVPSVFWMFLKSKEKLINSLKEGSGLDVTDSSRTTVLEMEALRHEKELQREEIQKLQGQVSTLRAEIQVSGFDDL